MRSSCKNTFKIKACIFCFVFCHHWIADLDHSIKCGQEMVRWGLLPDLNVPYHQQNLQTILPGNMKKNREVLWWKKRSQKLQISQISKCGRIRLTQINICCFFLRTKEHYLAEESSFDPSSTGNRQKGACGLWVAALEEVPLGDLKVTLHVIHRKCIKCRKTFFPPTIAYTTLRTHINLRNNLVWRQHFA